MPKLVILLFFFSLSSQSQDIFGNWKTIDDETGEAKSTVTIYKQDGKVFGKIINIYDELDKDALCYKCEGEEYNKPVVGLVIIKNLEQDGKYYENGTVFDPERGKKYKCRIALSDDNPNVLEVRGYISFFYATQYWERIN
jgi:uncharacterized protein (DUF2147 family)